MLTAKAQRWDPAEALRVLLEAEIEGRDRSTIENRRRRAHFPAGKTFGSWVESRWSIPPATQRAVRNLEWVFRAKNLGGCWPAGHREKSSPGGPRPSRHRPRTVRGLVLHRGPRCPRPPASSRRQHLQNLRRSRLDATHRHRRHRTSIHLFADAAEGRPLACRCRLRETLPGALVQFRTPPVSISSWTKQLPLHWSTACSTTPMSWSPMAYPYASKTPWPEKEWCP